MADDKFDAIVVGAGIAGAVAAYVMAKAGLTVLVIERGESVGSKNMTGGRLYAHSLEKIMPGFAQQAPLERQITHEKLSFLTTTSAVTVDYQGAAQSDPSQQSYSVLRSQFDPWLMTQAENAGAQLITGIRVDELVYQDNVVIGVKAGDDIIESSVVILAEGANNLLSQSMQMGFNATPQHLALGVKELIQLPQQQLEDRFNLINQQGTAWLFAGSPSDGLSGGGFLYTNRDSISLGIVGNLAEIAKAKKSMPQMLAEFKQHPTIAPLIQGGKRLEYSAHMIAEGGLSAMTKLRANGVLIIGEAAGLSLNLGFTVRGMDLAVTSADAAAQAVIAAVAKQDFSEQRLALYQTLLAQSYLLKALKRYKKLPQLLQNPRLFNQYPQMAVTIMQQLFTIDGQPNKPLLTTLFEQGKQVGLMNLLKDMFKGVRAL